MHPPTGDKGPTLPFQLGRAVGLSRRDLLAMVREHQRAQWQSGNDVLVEVYLQFLPALREEDDLLDLLYAEVLLREELRGQGPEVEEYVRRFPEHEASLRRQFELHAALAPERTAPSPETQAPSAHAADLQPNEVRQLSGRYRIERLLGRGGMGSVYLAHDIQRDCPVALKVPSFAAEKQTEVCQRFHREARAAASLTHPNICPVYDVGDVGGRPYLSMAYIEGRSLLEHLRAEGRWGPRQAATLVYKLALALEEAHQRGVLHRDLKPSNIMIDRRGEPMVMDFGLARLVAPGEARLTQSGEVLGTPAYMAVEQASGDRTALGPRSDVYSLGVIFYELLTGRLPFEGSVMEVLARLATQEPVPVTTHRPDLDPALGDICGKAMARNRNDRYPSMAAFAEAIRGYLGGPGATEGVRPVDGSGAEQALRRSGWSWGWLVICLTVLVGLVVVFFASSVFRNRH